MNRWRLGAVAILVLVGLTVWLLWPESPGVPGKPAAVAQAASVAGARPGSGNPGDPAVPLVEAPYVLTVTSAELTPSFHEFHAEVEGPEGAAAMARSFHYDFGDGTSEDSISGKVQHVFAYPKDPAIGMARYNVEVTATLKDGRVVTDGVTIEFSNTVGVMAATGYETLDARNCIPTFSPNGRVWGCETRVMNHHTQAFIPERMTLGLAEDEGAILSSTPRPRAKTITLPLPPGFTEIPGREFRNLTIDVPMALVSKTTVSLFITIAGKLTDGTPVSVRIATLPLNRESEVEILDAPPPGMPPGGGEVIAPLQKNQQFDKEPG
jgi:hypothetical protein